MKKTKRNKAVAPPLKAPDLGIRDTAIVMLWLDYCTQCFEKQLKLWRRAAKLHRDAASRGSVRYHEDGLKALRWARGHAEQVAMSRGWAQPPDDAVATIAKHLAGLWEKSKL